MASMLPMAVYGLEVPPGTTIPAQVDLSGTIRITMAALDPSASPDLDSASDAAHPRATLKIIRTPVDDYDEGDDEDDDDIDAIRGRLGDAVSDEEDEDEDEDEEDDEDDEDKHGGPSDPAKSKKARKEAAVKQLIESLKEDAEMGNVPNGVNGKVGKGKGKATDEDLDIDDDEDEDGEEVEEFVICTLDPERHYQQPLDITIGEDEEVYFHVVGTHSIYLTGNYVAPPNDEEEDDDEEDYDLSPDEDELNVDNEEEEDELDGLEDPRVMEVDTDEEEAPELIAAAAGKKDKKGKNKRPAEESDEEPGLDDLISKSLKPAADTTAGAIANGEQKLSKKQLKKLKKNDGAAAAAAAPATSVPADEKAKKDAEKSPANGSKADKKVQFAKNLEQGPTGSPANKAGEKKDEKAKPAASTGGVKVVQGVKIEDKKTGGGPAAKKGDRVGMRYIGKLEKDGKVFDANKKGKPFTFKLGAGDVIKGWDIGVAGMTVGGERRITIPAHLAYGSKAQAGIPANSNLVFDLKLISIN